MTTPTDFLRLALDPVRLAVLGHAVSTSADADRIAHQTGFETRRVLEAISTLRMAGLLDDSLRLDRDRLVAIAQAMPAAEPVADTVVEGPWSSEEIEVLSRFFVGSRLKEIPAVASKRLVILERLVQEFEPGIRYDERDVNQILLVFHPDYAALRRYLVDHGLLTRADGVYWRTGGRYQS